MLIKIQLDATVCRYLFSAKSLYMFRVSPHPSSGVLKTVTAASCTGHNIGAATSLQRGQIWPRWREVDTTFLLKINFQRAFSQELAQRYCSLPFTGTSVPTNTCIILSFSIQTHS